MAFMVQIGYRNPTRFRVQKRREILFGTASRSTLTALPSQPSGSGPFSYCRMIFKKHSTIVE